MIRFKRLDFGLCIACFRSKFNLHQRTFCSRFQANINEAGIRNSSWESVVGLEVHAQIQTKSKLFSGAGTAFSAAVNSQVSFFDASFPGTLPVLNRACVEAAVLTALALNSSINKVSMFDRKHYFYADLPLGYQITQQRMPLAQGGYLEFVVWNASSPYKLRSKIHQIQLEQDSGKSLHDEEARCSLIDLNRAGIPLMEIVFEPDLKNGEEAAALIDELQLLLRCIGTCDGKMDEGSLRVDANVSVNRPGEALGTRTEIKNLNSVRTLSRAINFEISRQIGILEAGNVINNETRTFDTKSRETVPMRDKEMKQDYRFMPEPNLPPLQLQNELDGDEDLGLVSINHLRLCIPKLPEETRKYITTKYGLPVETANILLREEGLLNFFEELVSTCDCDFKVASNFILNDLFAALHEKEMNMSICPISPQVLGMLLELKIKGVISEAIKDQVLQLLIDGDLRTPLQIIKDNKWEKITDTKDIEDICFAVLEENAALVKKYKAGKVKVFNQLLGLVKKKSNTIDMKLADKILREKIKML